MFFSEVGNLFQASWMYGLSECLLIITTAAQCQMQPQRRDIDWFCASHTNNVTVS